MTLTFADSDGVAYSINFDKHQAHEPPMCKFGEFGGNSIVKNLMAFAPDAKLDTALKKIFP